MISSHFFSIPAYPQGKRTLALGGFLTELQGSTPDVDGRYEIHEIQVEQKYNMVVGWTLPGLQNLECNEVAYSLHSDFHEMCTAQGRHVFYKAVAVPNEPSKFLWGRKIRQLGRDEFENASLNLFNAYMKDYKHFSTVLGFRRTVDDALDLASRKSLARFQLDDNDNFRMMKKIVKQLWLNQMVREGKSDGRFVTEESYRSLSNAELQFLSVRGWE